MHQALASKDSGAFFLPFAGLRRTCAIGVAVPWALGLLQHHRRFVDANETTVGVTLREHVDLLPHPLPVALDQLDDMAFCVAVSTDKLIHDCDGGVVDSLSKLHDAREKGVAIVPASIRALAKGGTEMSVGRFNDGQSPVIEEVFDGVLDRCHSCLP